MTDIAEMVKRLREYADHAFDGLRAVPGSALRDAADLLEAEHARADAAEADGFIAGVKAAQGVVDTLIESLQEGLMTDAGLTEEDRTAMRHQVGALGVASAEICNPLADRRTSTSITEEQAVYGLLWRMRTTDKRIHEARHAILESIGNDNQRATLDWALRTFGPRDEPILEELP